MYVKRNYGFFHTFTWTVKPFVYGILYSLAICVIAYALNISFSLPWQPISVIGIAVAFYLGFKNNSSYDRTWEARKIWGGIVNESRTFGAAVCSFVHGPNQEEIKKELIYRHIAWLTALRHQLRLSREWEHQNERLHKMFNAHVCEEYDSKISNEACQLIPRDEVDQVMKSSNRAAQLLKNQSVRLQELRDLDYFEDFRHMEFHHIIANLYTEQGKSERIKNFPFPRQYASTALWLTYVFSAFVPFGLMDIFAGTWETAFILCPLISGLIIWIFFLMEKIGDYSENPFEGTYNDVPITSIARGIEIDLREMINDDNIPAPTEAVNGFLL